MKNKYVFILTLTIVCSLLLSLASEGLRSLKEKNIEIDKKKNILNAIGLNTTSLSNLDIDKYFIGLFGSPVSKSQHVKFILKNKSYQRDEIIYVGDSISDMDAAENNNIHFIGVGNNVDFGISLNIINDLSTLDHQIKSIE